MKKNLINIWEKFYLQEDPYGHDKYYSEFKRREDTNLLLKSKNLHFEKCLELGCGIGKITENLIQFCDKIKALDISHNALKRAKNNHNNYLDRIEFVQSDMYEVKFKNEEFDLIVGIEALDYTKKRDEQILKWFNWLKPGGYILFSGPNLEGYFTYNELLHLFDKPEWKLVEIKIVTTKFPLQWFISRIKILQNNFFWNLNIFFANAFPKTFAKHIAILVRKN